MRIILTDTIKDFKGEPVMITEGMPFTVRDAFMQALNQPTPDEQAGGQGAETKAKIFAMGIKMFQGKEVDLTVDEAALIKERAGIVAAALVYGRICELLDGVHTEA